MGLIAVFYRSVNLKRIFFEESSLYEQQKDNVSRFLLVSVKSGSKGEKMSLERRTCDMFDELTDDLQCDGIKIRRKSMRNERQT